MRIKGLWIAVALLLMLTVSGCGDGNSNTNGTLKLSVVPTDNSTRLVLLTAAATVTPSTIGANVSFVATQYQAQADGTFLTVSEKRGNVPIANGGVATWPATFTQQTSGATTVFVTASIGGISDTVSQSINKYVPVVSP